MKRLRTTKASDAARHKREERARLTAWTRFLRADRDWDWVYLLEVIEFKLTRMEKALATGMHVTGPDRAREIRAVRRLLKRVVADRYYDELSREHRKRWGRLSWREGDSDGRSVRMIFYFPKAKTAREQAQAHRSHRAFFERAARQQQAEIEEAFALMAKHLQGWWE